MQTASGENVKHQNDDNPLIVIASNRGPFEFHMRGKGDFAIKRGAGGLVTALGALVEQHDVLWVAAALGQDDHRWSEYYDNRPQEVENILLRLVRTDGEQYGKYYNTIANPLLWFIQHQIWNIPRTPCITHETWDAWEDGYVTINQQFADAIADTIENSVADTNRPIIILPQDYHLYMVPHFLRERLGGDVQIQPFIHIPWPGPDAWRILPEGIREPLFLSLLQSDRVGFQTEKDAFNFVQTCRFLLKGAHSRGSRNSIEYQGRKIDAVAYPISVDVEKLDTLTEEAQTRLLKSQLINMIGDNSLILRVDRIEPSKNILRGLDAYKTLLETHPEHQGKVQMLALLVPSRMEVEQYQTYLRDIMAEAGLINAEFSDELWEPIRIIVGDNYHRAIAAMQLSDVLLVNPIADGMNLVAKEGVLVNQKDGVLILSEYAGAFFELGEEALVISPYDIHGTVEAMHKALTMPHDERADRAAALYKLVRNADVKRWFYAQVDDAVRALSTQSSSDSTPETP